jgi:hypothetical protein
MRDPSNYVNLTLTTPVGPQTRSVATTQGIQRVERLRYWRRANDYGGGPPPDFSSTAVFFDSTTVFWDAV